MSAQKSSPFLINAVLGLAVVASLASNTYEPLPAREWNDVALENGPTFELAPGEKKTFTIEVSTTDARHNFDLMAEVMASPTGPLPPQDSGALEEAEPDTGAQDSAQDSTDDTAGEDPVRYTSTLTVRLQGDYEGPETLTLRSAPVVVRLADFGVFNGCTLHEACTVTRTFSVDSEGERDALIRWGARIKLDDSFQPCDSEGLPEGCLTEAPDVTVSLVISE